MFLLDLYDPKNHVTNVIMEIHDSFPCHISTYVDLDIFLTHFAFLFMVLNYGSEILIVKLK